jgi:DNA-binding response OmpR family regulator
MSSNFKVFVVEDDPILREIFETILAEDYGVVFFPDAESCLNSLKVDRPDMFLLDVGLPGIDGYELCRRIKADFDTMDIPVTFVSGLDDIEARLTGYDAGGEDFICKPFEPSELLRKVTRARRLEQEKKQLREMAGYAQRTAFTAMSGMSELGLVIEFMRKSFACRDSRQLAQQILDTLVQFGLQGAVQIRMTDGEVSLSAEGTDLPLETAILAHVRTQGRIFEFRDRGVYNYGSITILIKNMPLEDPERCGRLRDNLAILAEGADARCQAIEVESKNRMTKAGIGTTLDDVHAMLVDLKAAHAKEQGAYASLTTEMQESLIHAFVALGLTERQEESLDELIRKYFGALRDHHAHSHILVDKLGLIADRLKALA